MKSQPARLEVKNYWSPDIYNPWGWEPEDNSVFYLLEMNIGLGNRDESDIYSIIVCTPEGMLNHKNNKQNPTFYKILLLDEYRWDTVRTTIEEKLASIDALDSFKSSNQLADVFNWEYAGMK